MNNKIKLKLDHKPAFVIPPLLMTVAQGTAEESCMFLHRIGFNLYPELGQIMIPDVILAESLGYERPRHIRELIRRMVPRIKSFGETVEFIEETGKRGTKSAGHLLTVEQAFHVIAKSETPVADSILSLMVSITASFMKGELLPTNFRTAVEIQERLRIASERHREEKEARHDALKMISQGRRRKRKPTTVKSHRISKPKTQLDSAIY